MEAERNGCVAFANVVPHRLRMLKNLTAEPQHRTFLNVFVVDPHRPLHAPPTVATRAELAAVLVECVARLLRRTLPRDVALLIAARCGPAWRDEEHARRFRERARRAMQATRTAAGGFAYVHFGNCGMSSFVDPSVLDFSDEDDAFRGLPLNCTSSNSDD